MAYELKLSDLPPPQTNNNGGGYELKLEDLPPVNNQQTNPALMQTSPIDRFLPAPQPWAQSLDRNLQNLTFNAAGDIDTGLANAGQGVHNFVARALTPLLGKYAPAQSNINFSKTFGINNPTLSDQLLQGAGQYAPYAAGGEFAALPKVLDSVPALSRVPAVGNWLNRIVTGNINQMPTAAIYGMTQSPNPITGTDTAVAANTLGIPLHMAGSVIGKGVSTLAGTKNAMNAIGNAVLTQLNRASTQGAALSPQEAAENLATNYTDANGQPLNVDIGTVANNPALKGVYQSLKYVPFTGVSNNINVLNKTLSDNAINDVQAQIQNTGNPEDINAALNNAPAYFNNLASGVNNRANITQELKNNVFNVFDANRKISTQNYAPINNSDLRLDTLGPNNQFPNYASAANELLAQRENLNNLFDKDSDLSAALRNELDKAQGFLNNNQNYGVTLPEAVSRIQNLGKLAASANAVGRRYEGSLLNKMRDGLSTDVNSALVNSGNQDLATQLQAANNYYANNMVPFWQNNVIRKAVTNKSYIPPKATLATALHNPNSQSILMQLPNEMQNASLYQMLTKGKGTSSGVSNMDAEAIGNAYANLPVDAKTAIAQYNPQADQYFENLPGLFQSQSKIAGLDKQLQELKQQRYGATPEKSAWGDKVAKAAEGTIPLATIVAAHFFNPALAAALPVSSLLGRTTAKALTNPALINAYMSGSRLPVSTDPLAQALMRAMPAMTVPYFNQGGQ